LILTLPPAPPAQTIIIKPQSQPSELPQGLPQKLPAILKLPQKPTMGTFQPLCLPPDPELSDPVNEAPAIGGLAPTKKATLVPFKSLWLHPQNGNYLALQESVGTGDNIIQAVATPNGLMNSGSIPMPEEGVFYKFLEHDAKHYQEVLINREFYRRLKEAGLAHWVPELIESGSVFMTSPQGERKKAYVLAMEYVHGSNLNELRRDGTLSTRDIQNIQKQVVAPLMEEFLRATKFLTLDRNFGNGILSDAMCERLRSCKAGENPAEILYKAYKAYQAGQGPPPIRIFDFGAFATPDFRDQRIDRILGEKQAKSSMFPLFTRPSKQEQALLDQFSHLTWNDLAQQTETFPALGGLTLEAFIHRKIKDFILFYINMENNKDVLPWRDLVILMKKQPLGNKFFTFLARRIA
jgi:hypothetical protein